MPVVPRAPQRRPEREHAVLPEAPAEPFVAPEATPEPAALKRPQGRHIPRFLVLPDNGEIGVSTAGTTGAHRFPGSPTPVLGAALSLMGIASVEAACRPWRRHGKAYRMAHIRSDDPTNQERRSLASSRLPKV